MQRLGESHQFYGVLFEWAELIKLGHEVCGRPILSRSDPAHAPRAMNSAATICGDCECCDGMRVAVGCLVPVLEGLSREAVDSESA